MEALKPLFREQLESLRTTISNLANVKLLKGQPMSGSIFFQIANVFCDKFNSGEAPTIHDTFDFFVENEALKLQMNILPKLTTQLAQLEKEIPLPASQVEDSIDAIFRSTLQTESSSLTGVQDILSSNLQEIQSQEKKRIASLNEASTVEWIRKEYQNCQKIDDRFEFFTCYLERANKTLDTTKIHETVPMFLGLMKEQFSEVSVKADQFRLELERVTETLKTRESECEELRKKYEDDLMKIVVGAEEGLQVENDNLKAELVEKTTAISKHISEITELKNVLERTGSGEDVEKNSTHGLDQSLQQSFENAHQEILLLKLNLQQKDDEMASTLRSRSLDTEDKISEISQLKDLISQLRISLSEKNKSESLLEADLAQTQTSLETVKKKKDSLEEEVMELKQKIDEHHKLRVKDQKEHDSALKALREEGSERLKDKVSQMSTIVSDLQKELNQARNSILEGEKKRLTAEFEAEAIRRQQQKSDEIVKSYQSIKEELYSLKIENVELKATSTVLKDYNDELKIKSRSADQRLQDLERERSNLNREMYFKQITRSNE